MKLLTPITRKRNAGHKIGLAHESPRGIFHRMPAACGPLSAGRDEFRDSRHDVTKKMRAGLLIIYAVHMPPRLLNDAERKPISLAAVFFHHYYFVISFYALLPC